jgi:tetratricopeptide (TPR) repeat protein
MPTILFAAFAYLALTAAPAHAQSASDLGSAGWRSIDRDPDEAAQLFSQALTLRPGDAALHLGAGAAAYQRGRTVDATRALQRALDLDPTLMVASKLLGEIAYKDGDFPLAIRTYERALVHAPASGELAGRLERITGEMSRLESAASGVERISIGVSGPDHETLATRASAVLDSTYWRVAKRLGAFPVEPISVVLNSASPFLGSAGTPVCSESALRGEMLIPVRGAGQDLDAFDRVLAHQLTHAMVASMAPHGVPAWFQEGLAQYFEPADAELAERRLRAAGDLPWRRMLAHVAVDDRLAHDASLLAVHALIDRVGRRTTAVLDDLADGRSLDEALAPFGFTVADLQADVARKVEQPAR